MSISKLDKFYSFLISLDAGSRQIILKDKETLKILLQEDKGSTTNHKINSSFHFLIPLELIPAGSYRRGTSLPGERPCRHVEIKSFYMGRYPVTQFQWRVVADMPQVNRELDPDPASFKGNNRPVENVSWHDAVEFCDRLTLHTNHQYRLPSEAEWEYACRAGTTTSLYFGDNLVNEQANFHGNVGKTTPVGTYSPNAYGLYDMHGNVWEWCQDHWHDDYDGAPTDGSAWEDREEDSNRVVRGGCWYSYPRWCRSAFRNFNLPRYHSDKIGFRVVMEP